MRLPARLDAVLTTCHAGPTNRTTVLEQANMLIELHNKMGDLKTWVLGYNDSNGEIERGED